MATLIDKVYSLTIGVQGEHIARPIEFDMSAWIELYPDALFYVLFKPYNAIAASPQLSDYQDGILTWTPTLGATAVAGVGYTEVRAINPDTGLIRKSRIIPTSVEHSVTGVDSEDPPEPYADWVNRVLLAADTSESDRERAEIAMHRAEQAAQEKGYMDLWISMEDGHLYFDRTENVDNIDFIIDNGRLIALWPTITP